MIWILAAQLSLPLALGAGDPDVRTVFSSDDFPTYLQQPGQFEIVNTRTTVRPDGSIQNCSVERSSGYKQLDEYTCSIIVKRAKFAPAKWTDGSPVYGVIRVPVSWVMSEGGPTEVGLVRATVPDLELSVNQLPKGAHSIATVTVQVAADESGRPVSCAEWNPPKNAKGRYFPELVPIACKQVMAALTLTPPVDASAKPARSVQSVLVYFDNNH